MNNSLHYLGITAGLMLGSLATASVSRADQPLFVAYPPDGHETTSDRIFLIGTAAPGGQVTVNGQAIQRSEAGHFAPTLPLQLGENTFTLRYGDQSLVLHITRVAATTAPPVAATFAEGSLTPAVDTAKLPGERFCFGAIAPANATVSVSLGSQTIPLFPQLPGADLPANSAVLTQQDQPIPAAPRYEGCMIPQPTNWVDSPSRPTSGGTDSLRDLGQPQFHLTLNGQTITQPGPGAIQILSPNPLTVVAVTAETGTTRSGPSTDYSRLTPLPKGTRATVTGREGDWLQLDYGVWIKAAETEVLPNAVPPQSLIRSVRARSVGDWTEISFPLQVPVPITVQQGDRTFTLTLYNTTAQTDIIRLDDDPVIQRLDWQQIGPGQVQYTFNLKSAQQWGYKLRYDGTTLVLSLRHPPNLQTPSGHQSNRQPLAGMSILLDPGHGGPEDLGSRGPTGYPEKDVTLLLAKLVRERLEQRGATVWMTREEDVDLYPNPRADLINQRQPTLTLSLHYNALPDDGDAEHTAGVSTYWYNTQSHSLAMFLHHYLVQQLNRPSFGVYWDNLALTRPTVAPAVLLELGFMINPTEFEWITNPTEQEKLADAIATGIVVWTQTVNAE